MPCGRKCLACLRKPSRGRMPERANGGGMSGIAALIVAGGAGVRAGGGVPKQYRLLARKPVIRRAIETFLGHPNVSTVQPVIGAGHEQVYAQATSGLSLPQPVLGGSTRQESVRRGLMALRG